MTGLCQCGCGTRTALSAYTSRPRGWVKGQPRPFVKGHNQRGVPRGADYAETPGPLATPCWVWAKNLTPKGYARFEREGALLAHVAYWERANGPVPDGLELDHLCRNRACVNPAHLEPVTHKENMVRGIIARHIPGISSLRDVRVAARMSQDDLAALVGVTQPIISDWERGRRPFPSSVLDEIRKVG